MRLSRRTLLAATGATVLTPGPAVAAFGRHRLPAHTDVVVVGAGIAGLVTARELLRGGVRRVVVLEARHRVGGRVLNHHLPQGGTIERGGAFIGPTQDEIATLAAELGVPTFLEYNTGKSTYVGGPLGTMHYRGTVPPDPTILPDVALIVTLIDKYAAEIDVEAPWAHPQAAAWDAITLGDWVRQHALNKEALIQVLNSWTQPGFGADPDEMSFLFALWYVACSGNATTKGTFERNSDTGDGAQQRRFVGGSQLVPLRLAQLLHRHVRLAAPVTAIDQRGARALVHTTRGTVTAARVVVACPPSTVLDIDFAPAMPPARVQLLRGSVMGQLMKCDAIYERPFWRDAGLNGFGLMTSGATRAVFDNTPADGSVGVLLAFVGGSTWRQYGPLPLEQRRDAVLQGFAKLFGKQALSPIGYTEQDWNHEVWTRGGPTAIHGPGVLTRVGSAIRVPHGRVHWAGTETATYWTGYMDGAVRSGQRAAAEVLATL